MNDKGVYRTAPATPSMLKMQSFIAINQSIVLLHLFMEGTPYTQKSWNINPQGSRLPGEQKDRITLKKIF